ncbi:hypothetical protein LSH36_79g05013 [Paralvinella palmiformis]|uniref:Uncharacterized protein n=1 Tax=Paralvinella palmiformis TaxID=53620 RepID=A0AAD9K3W8_9ANNE|nr:hypothetical protein LSH36_79g05013 [Paralvinella palmiformis]
MMSSHCKRPASPSHCTRYVHATKRPRFALQDSSLLEIRIRKRKYSEDVCESCLNNRRAEKAYCTKEILHNTYRSAGRNATSSDSGSFHCINFQADTNVANNLDLGHIDGIRSITDTEIKSRKKQRIYPPDTMQIIYKDLSQSKSTTEESVDADPKFNSFNFWKPVLPDINLQLCSILEDKMETESSPSLTEEENPDFNSFNYWRLPVEDIDLDIL